MSSPSPSNRSPSCNPACLLLIPQSGPLFPRSPGRLRVRSCDLRVHGISVAVEGRVPSSGEQAVFFRPVVAASAFTRRDGAVLADAWPPDLVRLGELEAHLGDGVIEETVSAALAAGCLTRRQRRRITS